MIHHITLAMSTTSDSGDGPLPDWMVVCDTCGDVLEWFMCRSEENGNQGRWMVKASLLLSFSVFCSLTDDPPVYKSDSGKSMCSKITQRCQFFCFAYRRKGSPSLSPKVAGSRRCKQLPRKPKAKCIVIGCNSHRVNALCLWRVCRKHRRALGGCEAATDHTDMCGPSTENLKLDDSLLHDLTPTLPPSALAATPADKGKGRAVFELEDDEEIDQLVSSDPPAVQDVCASDSHTVKPPVKPSAPPRFARQMLPQFTQQIAREQSLEEEDRRHDAARIESARRAKYSVTVYGFLEVSYCFIFCVFR